MAQQPKRILEIGVTESDIHVISKGVSVAIFPKTDQGLLDAGMLIEASKMPLLKWVIKPTPNAPSREFTFIPDPYGASIIDAETGLAVTLDWDGDRLTAIITAEGQDDPTFIHTVTREQLAVINSARVDKINPSTPTQE